MIINRITQIDEKTINAFRKLVPQLTGKQDYPSREELEKVVQCKNTFLFFAIDEGEIIGTLTLVFYQIPSGLKAWIEDVIVDENARGKGVATALMWHAINTARKGGALKVDLTSLPRRIAANQLYLKLGFEKRESNMYRYYLSDNK